MNARNGLILSSIAPIALTPPIPSHCPKLVSPKIAPAIAPPIGPNTIAQIATGITLNEIASGPMFKYPSGVYAIINKIAVIRPRMASCVVVNFFVFIFPPCSRSAFCGYNTVLWLL